MKIIPINKTYSNTSVVNNSVNTEFKQFMSEINKWTEKQLKLISSKYQSGSVERENAIEYLFYIRESRIENKKRALFGKQPSLLKKLHNIIF